MNIENSQSSHDVYIWQNPININHVSSNSLPNIDPRFTIDLTGAISTSTQTETSSGGGFYKISDKSYFLKPGVAYIPLTSQQQEYFASSEVASNTITRLLTTGTEGAPRSFVGILSDVPYIVSEKIDFNDLAFFRKSSVIDDFVRSYPEMKAEDIDKLKANGNKIALHYSNIKTLENNRPTDWWKTSDQTFIDDYRAEARPLRELIVDSLKLLPIDLQKMVQEHIIVGQIVGDWDFLNERFENIGISKNSDGQYRVASLDRGISFGVGFWGKSKQEGYHDAVNQRPPAFLPLNSIFTQEKAIFGKDLPDLGKDFSYMPYGDVAKLASGKVEWLPENLKKIAYRITVANEQKLINRILDDTLVNLSYAGLEGHRFIDKNHTIDILGARLLNVIEQAGGNDQVILWGQQNPTEAAKIRNDVTGFCELFGYAQI